ncbi:CHAT domain-containing protein [Actinoplanes sp. NPDC023714]|uniref:CHAT domain-containing protein n=1 Tax=Actinoplanes sp. NPDC023714 TaxID=3154322 RepID=UPI0033F58C06
MWAVLAAKAAVRAFERGDLDRAEARLRRAARLFGREEDSVHRRSDLGRVHHLNALVHLERRDVEAALHCFALAEDELGRDPRNRVDHGRAMLDAAKALIDLGIGNLGASYLDRAERSLGDRPEYRDQLLQMRFAQRAGTGQPLDEVTVAAMRRRTRQATDPAERAAAEFNLGAALLDSGGSRDEAWNLMKKSVDFLAGHHLGHFVDALAVLSDSRRRGEDFPPWCDDASRRAVAAAERSGNLELRASAHLHRAGYLLSAGDLDGALRHALTAVARGTELSLRTEASVIRLLQNSGGEAAREIALIVACRRGDAAHAALAAELIESARLQVLPVTTAEGRSYRGRSTAGLLTSIGASGTTRLRPVAVDGTSRLAGEYAAGSTGPALDFQEYVERVGGPGAWWWGGWAFNERVYWCVRGEGVAECGYVEAGDDTEAGRLLHELTSASPVNPDADLDSEFNFSYRVEEELSVALGRELIPPPLLRALAGRERADPLSLVLSGVMFAVLPTALLGVEPPSPTRHPKRLLEVAVLRTAAPAVLIDHVAGHPAYPAEVLPIGVACVDPTGDLAHARVPPDGAGVVLSGAPGARAATARELREALERQGRSYPGLFYYSGHAGGDGDLESGLLLQDAELTAADLFTARDGRPAYPFPVRALLAACSSAGAGGSGAGEWFGLSAAVLWSGARQVVATNWPVLDTRFTTRFDHDLARELCHSSDAARALRRVQLDCLERWRSAPHGPPPIIWSAYACVGTHW